MYCETDSSNNNKINVGRITSNSNLLINGLIVSGNGIPDGTILNSFVDATYPSTNYITIIIPQGMTNQFKSGTLTFTHPGI